METLAAVLRSRGGLRCRTGLLLTPPEIWEDLPEIAALVGMPTIDHAAAVAESLPAGTHFVDISADSEIARFQSIALQAHHGDPLLLYNSDICLARLPQSERNAFWTAFFDQIPYLRYGLLIALPDRARTLFPPMELCDRIWKAGRMGTVTLLPPSLESGRL